MIPKRIETVHALGLNSIYKGGRPKKRLLTDVFGDSNKIAPDMNEALKKLNELVRLNGGNLYVIDLYRSWDMQAEARRKFDSGKKKAFVAKPGESFHNAARAVDISVKELGFDGVDKEEWVQLFWALAKPLGFCPIVSTPDLGVSEVWHFDYPGDDWSEAYDLLRYGEAAKCCALDVGAWNPNETEEKVRKMFIQSQCIRLGFYDVGTVDGVFGPKTKKVLDYLGVVDLDTVIMSDVLSRRSK